MTCLWLPLIINSWVGDNRDVKIKMTRDHYFTILPTRKSSYGKMQEVYCPRHNMSKHNLLGGTWLGGTLGYPLSGSVTSHWGTPHPDWGPVTGVPPRKDMGPVEVLWDGDGVPLGKDMEPVEVLWDGDGVLKVARIPS